MSIFKECRYLSHTICLNADNNSSKFYGCFLYFPGFKVFKTEDLRTRSASLGKGVNQLVTDFDFVSEISLASQPVHLAVSKDGISLLCVLVNAANLTQGLIFDVRAFSKKVTITHPSFVVNQ